MFNQIKNLILKLFTDLQGTFLWIFAIGILLCAIVLAFGDEQNAPKFKKGLIGCLAGIVVFLLAKPVVEYVQSNLK